MLPRFALPPVETGGNINLATKPKQVETWLSRLPYADASEATAELTDFIATCVRIRTPTDRLGEILDIVLPTATQLIDTLRQKCITEGLPLPPVRQQTAESCTRLLSEIAHACKLIILERAGHKFNLFGAKPFDQYLYILIHTLKQVLEINMETHQNPPPGIWLDLHQAYGFALAQNLARTRLTTQDEAPCLDDVYKSAILFALADPFRIPKEELHHAKELIARSCSLLDLTPADDHLRHGAVFAIAFDIDNPVIVLSRETGVELAGWDLLVNTTQLVKRLSLLAGQYAKQHIQANHKRKSKVSDLAHLELIHRLKLHWGGSIQRMGARHPRFDNSQFEVCFGFPSIHRLIYDPAEDPPQARSPYSEQSSITLCSLINDSVGGLALAKDRPVGFHLRIGDLVAVRQGGGGEWGIGIVRWFRSNRAGRAIFGLQLIAPRAVGIKLQRPDMEDSWPGLLLPATPSLRQGEMMLVQPGKLNISDIVSLLSGREPIAIRTDKLVELTPCFEAYHYQRV